VGDAHGAALAVTRTQEQLDDDSGNDRDRERREVAPSVHRISTFRDAIDELVAREGYEDAANDAIACRRTLQSPATRAIRGLLEG
jgi:hypothetical protein